MLNVLLVEVFSLEGGILGVHLSLLVHLLFYLFFAVASLYQRIDIQVGSDEYLVVLPHVYHILVGLTEGFQGFTEGIEATLQTLYEAVLADACQTAADNLRIIVETWGSIGFQIGDGLIAGVGQFFVEHMHSSLEEVGQVVVQLVFFLDGLIHLGESVDVLVIASDVLDVCSCTPNGQRFDHSVANLLCQLLKLLQVEVLLFAELTELHHQRREEGRQVGNAIYGTMTGILEHQYLVVDVRWRIVHRRC